jgi:hypothetical protein
LISLFRSKNLLCIILVPLAAVLLWLTPLLNPPTADVQFSMPLFTKIFDALRFNWEVKIVLAVVLVLAMAFLLNYISTENELTANNYLSAFMFVVLCSSSINIQKLNAELFANLFLMLALWRVFNMYKTDGAIRPPFDAGLLISIASFFYFPAIGMVIMLYIAIAMLRPFHWRDFAVATLGIIIPYLYLSVYYFWFDKLPYFWNHYIAEPFLIRNLNFNPNFTDYWLVGIIALLVLVSLFDNFTNPTLNRSIRRRKYLNVMVVYLMVSFGCFVLTPDWSPMHFVISALPLSVFFSNFLLSFKFNYFPEAIIWMLLIVIAANQFGL